jgi:hypothetical protein
MALGFLINLVGLIRNQEGFIESKVGLTKSKEELTFYFLWFVNSGHNIVV